jgi:hypothetical protein
MVDHWNFIANESTTGSLFEVSGGWAAQTRFQRAGGHSFSPKKVYTPEEVVQQYKNITDFGEFCSTNLCQLFEPNVRVCLSVAKSISPNINPRSNAANRGKFCFRRAQG